MIMLIGPVGAGKTTLLYALQNSCQKVQKTQSICFSDGGIDTPGEYAQIPRFYSALMVTSYQADMILLVQDATERRATLPPGFAAMFPCAVTGVITKIDAPGADCDQAAKWLTLTGIKDAIFQVSAVTGEGIDELLQYISERRCKHG